MITTTEHIAPIEIDTAALDDALRQHADAIQRLLPPAILVYAWADLPEVLQEELLQITGSVHQDAEFFWYAVIPERYAHHDLLGATCDGVHKFSLPDGFVGHLYWNETYA